MNKYDPKEIEPKWQVIWEESNIYKADLESKKEKFFGFGMFNYPSGAGIHVGHVRNYTIPDVITRFKRQQGFATYQPVGWDSFGLPAENYAIKTGVSPQESTQKAIEKYQQQYRAMGWGVDWTKEIDTTDPSYYRWTQWIFTKLFENDLAYQKESAQWWCDKCKTVLADEQVINGKCWRHEGSDDPLVTKRNLKQWFFKITEYADAMLEATDGLNWTPSVKASQKSWIGKSTGAEIIFAVVASRHPELDSGSRTKNKQIPDQVWDDKKNKDKKFIEVFTTRPDTLFGATFLVLAPEHELVESITTKDQKTKVEKYVSSSATKTEVERQEAKDKTGVFSGSYAINPVNNEKVPIWIADYVLTGYGTGAIMAVPAHDERDYEFALKYNLLIQQVFVPCEEDELNPPQKGLEEVVRDTAIVHLLDKSTGKYALLDWHDSLEGITTAIMGGIEKGQTPEEAVLAEIKEEAALEGVKVIKKLRWITSAKYCASHKSQNRKAIAHTFLAEVENLQDQGEIDQSEQRIHTLIWVDKDDVLNKLVPSHQKMVWEQLWSTKPLIGEGELINSGKYNNLSSGEARNEIVVDLEKKGLAKKVTNYKMRDWLISRQRYWGAPIPIIHCEDDGAVVVPESDLPVLLPEIKDYKPTGGNVSVLAGVEDWVNTPCPKCGKVGKRETDTMDGYVCSSWYFLRYLSANDDTQAWDPELTKAWMPVDFYNGADHATAHLLYARFFTRFFHQLGLVNTPEPFDEMLYSGKIKAADGSVFSKTLANGQDPLEIIESGLGADALRVYEMFTAPLEQDVLWDPQGTTGAHKYLTRVWNLVQEYILAQDEITDSEIGIIILQSVHKTIKKVSSDINSYKYNTAIAAIMEMTNVLYKQLQDHGIQHSSEWKFAIDSLLQLLAPFAPHITEELWHQLDNTDSIHIDSWPKYDPQMIKDDVITIVIQVNGKLRGEFVIETGASKEALENKAIELNNQNHYTKDLEIIKTVVVPARLVNFVVKQ